MWPPEWIDQKHHTKPTNIEKHSIPRAARVYLAGPEPTVRERLRVAVPCAAAVTGKNGHASAI